MKKIIRAVRGFFLFQTHGGAHPVLFWLYNAVMLLLSGVGIGLASLALAYGQYPYGIFLSYFHQPMLLFLNLLVPVLLVAFFYGLIGRAWAAYGLSALIVLGASVGNYFKLAFRGDPFMMADVPDIIMGVRFGARYGISLDRRLLLVLAVAVLGFVFLLLFVRGRIRFRFRVFGSLAVLLGALGLAKLYTSDHIYYSIQNTQYINRWSATEVYLSKGFVYPFLYSTKSAIPSPPAGYSAQAARDTLARYETQDIPEDEKVNLFFIQLEAFADLTTKGVDGISDEVYRAYHALEAEGYAGNLVTNIFAAGTVDSERCVVTGDIEVENFRRKTGSYLWYFRDQGYTTTGSHPCYRWFYNRRNINEYLGAESYHYWEDRYYQLSTGGIPYDDILLPDLLRLYQARDQKTPYLNFSVTYQGHGPYSDTELRWGDGFYTGDLSDASATILNNYLGSVQDTSNSLTAFFDGLRTDDAPVIVVLWGDHMPWLGDNNAVYQELGVDLDVSGQTGFFNYYATRYLIWANDAAKAVLGNDFTGTGPDLSPCYLMNELFTLCGWDGPAYLQLMDELYDALPVVNTDGFYLEDGALTTAPSDDAQALLREQRIVEYYRKRNPAVDE